jgi:nanoRNase/pAp phosphatase (c-di-AMP/oligoRNAs hydrolase)
MSEVVSDATKSVDGQSGGHTEAAGATIPAGAEEKFIAQCEQLLSAKRQTTQ